MTEPYKKLPPNTYSEFSRRDDLLIAAWQGGWNRQQANAFFPVLSIGEVQPAQNFNPTPMEVTQPSPVVSTRAHPSKRQLALTLPIPEYAENEEMTPDETYRDKFKPKRPRGFV